MSGSCLFGLLLVSNIATFVSSFSVSYFAYGSNLNRSVLQVRTASLFIPPPVAVRLPDWVLTINLGTAASVEECVGGYCEGRVYELSPRAFALLCATEVRGSVFVAGVRCWCATFARADDALLCSRLLSSL